MLFSIIIPCFNRRQTLPGTLNSLLAQTHEDWEVVIVDDGSFDETDVLVRECFVDSRIRYVKQSRQGVSFARNHGARLSKGEYLLFLDADDCVTPNWLSDFQRLIDEEQSEKEVGYASCGCKMNGVPKEPNCAPDICDQPYLSLAGTFVVHRRVFEQIEGYDTVLRQSENWELVARALRFCTENGLLVKRTENYNFQWQHSKTPGEVRERDLARAEALLYLFEKYEFGGVFHGRRESFLSGAGVNFSRAGKPLKSLAIFLKCAYLHPSPKSFLRILCVLVPPIRRRVWGSSES